ncbi:MAG: macrolide ABC transporter ATP-binding protein [Candidatus Portnoybacteria bacterium RIFCSPLOWO2_12_FULL_39_9]|uniref:Macrolide ABC transporter ATP-binding protein n=1 Tax=Candidatus Portnoybacteria bacterium RIFCSPHIGHO2_12_FULL_38_9 TaxID=1801997 RepID=A0A1G2FHH0_9BACT|nr:MAG: macrolide ABC transporter ATP-binding protein [Candidatus Portnoybacteria bacterium RBG_13_40_8]OGZ35438.1 MAG: macrolide ABC transporter ATP-binding protein [Candidatus Portnoybacteria bacterium RIFCSPHIGHO2_02_FULL_39_12]OGZ36971.1 MAG: macrolide ABC transporter ATP-binding protein [Candidatus Portnoybacteria bacterium RIFCSPHIGHO2_12_FULL_38_9]OGZ37961.1 MAG: macrolide ABC transporter ATP-binding protein [Candidatus Portnoybacteria bacterium RIFCSPLOWO2_01_FULL_38_39]OGZ39984.1 MAG: 
MPDSNIMFLIEVKDLEKTYYDGQTATPALRDISFTINQGEFAAIMGPSGSGKSTLLHILGFLDKQTAGDYFFNGKTMNDYSKKEIAQVRNKKMGFVFQAFNLLARTSVLENVRLPLIYSEIKESFWDNLTLKAIEAVGLSHRLNHLSSQLSGGEKQRVAIARALVNNPQVIFADEPTGNLDSKSGKAIMETLRQLNLKGQTIILITHEKEIADYTQRIIFFRDGRIERDSGAA